MNHRHQHADGDVAKRSGDHHDHAHPHMRDLRAGEAEDTYTAMRGMVTAATATVTATRATVTGWRRTPTAGGYPSPSR